MNITKSNLERERKIALAMLVVALAIVIFSTFTSAAEASYCCEKTTDGKFCQNAPESQCDSSFKKSPTACESTSYCKPGCCFNEVDGICMEGTPQKVCQDNNGIWGNDVQCNIPQCNLGCCIMGDQGAFVTLTRCKQLSGFYGLKTDFRRTITDEATCIATAQQADKGACVTEDATAGVKKCVFTTRAQCSVGNLGGEANITLTNTTQVQNNTQAPVGFYKDTLCSAPELGSICGRSTKTVTIDGKDEVYFTDTCGNIANIYDASRFSDNQYWKKVFKKSESCGYGSSNAGSTTCGNCDYFRGSIAKKASRSTGFPSYGDYICVDLSCKTAGKQHGESWCVSDSPNGNGQDTVGSRYYKEVCLFNEVVTEPCADFRGDICIQDSLNGFSEAACRTNRWQDCLAQKDESDCTNSDVRDCLWRPGYYLSSSTSQIEKTNNDTEKGDLTPEGLCMPKYPPGLTFWGSTSSSSGTTAFSSTTGNFSASSSQGTGYVSPSSSSGTSASTQCAFGNVKVSFNWEQTTHPAMIGGSLGKLISGLTGTKDSEWGCANGTEGDTCRIYIAEADWSKANITDDAIKKWSADMNVFCGNLGDCGGKANFLGASTDNGYATYHGQLRVAGSGGAKIIEKAKTATTTSTAATGTSSTAATGTSSTGTSSTSSALSTIGSLSNAASSATGAGTGTTTGKGTTANVIAPIQGRVIMDYFKNMFGGAK